MVNHVRLAIVYEKSFSFRKKFIGQFKYLSDVESRLDYLSNDGTPRKGDKSAI